MTAAGDGVPAGWHLELDPSARRTDAGRVLIGGAPLRVLRLTAAGARWLDGVVGGRRVSSAPGERRLARRLVDAGLARSWPQPGVGPSRRDVTVVVPVRDMTRGLVSTLAAIGDVAEVIVVDDGSRDPGDVRAAAGAATVLRNERSLGPAAARERGWRASSSPFVAFVDAEVDAPSGSDWLSTLLPVFEDGAVGAVAPRVRPAAGTAPEVLAAYEQVRSSLDLGPRAAPVRPGSRVPYVPTTALVVRRDALESVGGFDTDLRVGEDVDLVWRLVAGGWRVRYEPTVEVTHPSRPTVGAWIRQRVAYGTSAAALARRHGPAAAPLTVSGWTGATAAAVLGGLPLVGAGIAAASVGTLARRLPDVDHPVREAARIVGSGNLWAARQAADAARRPWWPFALVLAVLSRRARPAVLAAFAVPTAIDAWRARADVDPVRFGLLRLADDIAYGTGVWVGCVRERSARALLPARVRAPAQTLLRRPPSTGTMVPVT